MIVAIPNRAWKIGAFSQLPFFAKLSGEVGQAHKIRHRDKLKNQKKMGMNGREVRRLITHGKQNSPNDVNTIGLKMWLDQYIH